MTGIMSCRSVTPHRTEAALALCPGNLPQGLDELDGILTLALRKIGPLKRCIEISALLATTAALSFGSVLYLSNGESGATARLWIEYVASLAALGSGFVGWQMIQHSEWGRRLFDPSESLPGALQRLIAELASGERSAQTISETVPRELFRSLWAILLFSPKAEVRGWVRSATGHREIREIFCRANQSPASVDIEPKILLPPLTDESGASAAKESGWRQYKQFGGDSGPNLNRNPADQWITSADRRDYERKKCSALVDTAPHKLEMRAFILDGIRHELRAGGQRGTKEHAIEEIRMELIRVFGGNGGYSESAIGLMMSSGARNASLRAHFQREQE